MIRTKMKRSLESWKYPAILLFGIGLSNIGAWIYFIALNLIVLELTQSPLALSILYIIRPIAGLLANLWAGTIADRVNKKKAMVILDFFRALILCLLLFNDSILLIYGVTLIAQLANSVFGNTSFIYITKLIPEQQRPRFNSLHSLLSSGAFIIGPAIAGFLLLIGTPLFAIATNIVILIISGLVTLFMPNVENFNYKKDGKFSLFSFNMMRSDFLVVKNFYQHNKVILALCLAFGGLMVVMASSVDSLEASFAKYVLLLSDADYGLLVSIAGIGMATGALLNVITVNRLSVPTLISVGVLGNVAGYATYAFSHSFLVAAIGFFILCFFLAFANTGFMIYYQKQVPTDIMGRIGAFNGLIESSLIIIITTIFGIIADAYAIRPVIISGIFIMFILSITIVVICMKHITKPKTDVLHQTE